MSYEEENLSGSEHDFGDLFGSEDEASDIDDGRSPSPVQPPLPVNNTLDNLFGSDDESEQEEEEEQQQQQQQQEEEEEEKEEDERQMKRQRSTRIASSDDEHHDQDYDQPSSRKQRVEVALEMPQLSIPYSDNDKYYLAKLPRFLDIEMNPFVPDEFQIQVPEGLTEAQEQEAIREQIENTIRWKRVQGQDGRESMTSNAHLVEWEDGKLSLMLGDECFDVSSKPVGAHEHAYLLAHQTDSGALESQTEFTHHITFRPSGLKSDTHRHLTAQIADKQIKKNKTKMFFTEKDPELMKQELETQENERLKAQKKLELQRRKADMRFGDVSLRRQRDFGEYETTDYQRTQTHSRQDRYEDDFVVDDDDYDEEEERSREDRLAQVKHTGMDRYKRARHSEEEEEEEEEEDEEEEDEEVVIRRHKRSRMLSDEDDE
ncbi:Leo1-like protein-domain-containing protein [Gilbertella persicaria]|uniref:Leo1-like protein-domain-containing protein n=1 Tax=Gilbertella persicaria TaxID=101096 RepID=UPI00221EBD6B|nr:Leo1-like protein-domain-containing protein [Gilbertella persicaria]KAI8054957.1 Leo1-like protein-domain-containing protein [Gilbertella persicaria]